MLNPLVTPDEILKKFPKVYLLICEKDPLHDGGLKYGLNLIKLKKDVSILRFRFLPHGILNMALPQGMPEGYKYEKKNIELLNKEFDNSF